MFKVLLTSMIAMPMFASPDVGAKSRSGFFIEASVFGQRAKGSFKKNSDLLDKYKRFQTWLKQNEATQKKIAEDVNKIQHLQANLNAENDAAALIQNAYKTTTDIEFNGDTADNIDNSPGYSIDTFKMKTVRQARQYKSIGPGMFVVRKDRMIRVDADGFAKKLDDPGAEGDSLIQAGVVTRNDGALNNPANAAPDAKFVAYRMTERPMDVFDGNCGEEAATGERIDLDQIDRSNLQNVNNFYYATDNDGNENEDFIRLNAKAAWKTHTYSADEVVADGTLRASIAIGLDDKSLEAAGLPTLKALNFLNLSGHGVVQNALYVSEDTKTEMNGNFFLTNARTFGVNVDSNIKAAIDESLSDFDKFKSSLISYAKKKGLAAEEGNSDLAYSDAKKFSFGADVTLGCRQSIGDFDLFGGLTASFVFAKKTLEITDSDSSSNDSSSSNDANTSDENKDNETSTNLKYQIDVKMKPSFGFTLGLAYRILQNFSAGVGVDITNARYEINTNDINKLFIAENDVVADRLSELGASTYNFNKDVIEKGLGNNKLSVSKWGVSPYVKLTYHLNDCASIFLKFGYDRRHILQNSNTSIGELKLTGMKFGLGINLNI